MFTYIQKLQQKPPEERKKVAFVVAAAVTGIIFFVWLGNFLQSQNTTPSHVTEKSPLDIIKDRLEQTTQESPFEVLEEKTEKAVTSFKNPF